MTFEERRLSSLRILGLAFLLCLAGCIGSSRRDAVATPPRAERAYAFSEGDVIRIEVYEEEELSGRYVVDSQGRIAMPLIGAVEASGETALSLSLAVRERLLDGYLIDPFVTAQLVSERPFYILGEVRRSGRYPFEDGMTVFAAVASAGGFTYRAKKERILVTPRNAHEDAFFATLDTQILPGDRIEVLERYF